MVRTTVWWTEGIWEIHAWRHRAGDRGFHKGRYQTPVLGSKGFIERVREKLGDKARVDGEQPQSRQVFSLEIEKIAGATVREYGKRVDELKRRKPGEENEARMVAINLSQQLGGHKHGEIGKIVG